MKRSSGSVGGGNAFFSSPEHVTALAFSIIAIGQLLFASCWGRLADARGVLPTLAAVAFLLSINVYAIANAASVAAFLVWRVAQAALWAGSLALSYAAVSLRQSDDNRSTAISIIQSAVRVGLAVGPFIGAAAVNLAAAGEAGDERNAFVVSAYFLLAVAVVLGSLHLLKK